MPPILDARYQAFFRCFNQALYFEAHEVLEPLWLAQRSDANGLFYKGLIQLAGAFVHVKKHRLQPALRLFKLAQANLARYPATHEELDLVGVQTLINQWLSRLSTDANHRDGVGLGVPPVLHLIRR